MAKTNVNVENAILEQEITDADFFGTDVVEVKGDNGGVAIFNPENIAFYTSIDRSTLEGKAKVFKALGNSDYSLKNVAEKKVMLITDIVAHNVELVNEQTGLAETADRIIMVMEDGQTVSGCSKGFKSSITNMLAVYGKPPFSPALPLVVMCVQTRKGRETFNLMVATDDCTLPRIGGKAK
jgi:NACalpha-BTF3-like transcription factor